MSDLAPDAMELSEISERSETERDRMEGGESMLAPATSFFAEDLPIEAEAEAGAEAEGAILVRAWLREILRSEVAMDPWEL
jgi:hypothetical protein